MPRQAGADPAALHATELPVTASQGALVIGRSHPAAKVTYLNPQLADDPPAARRVLRVDPTGRFVFGIGRDQRQPLQIEIRHADGRIERRSIAITARGWPVERIRGVPPATIDPPPAIAARIAREQAQVAAVRSRDDARSDFAEAFAWPVRGRISGRFGNQRVYVRPDGRDVPKSPHSGMDIAAANGTPVLAPAAGIVTFARSGLYLTGGTLVLDHGAGVSSNFLHLSRIDVQPGDRVVRGQQIATVGATGRATGPHLHWGMNWFDTRIDPLLVLDAATDN
ncbi:MAG TPA: M23 family metallopeptidase [Xanthomonadaceae bacterium]|nr:M23 family metallopeptidase [Xanthomonadaceae bacterium]